jgi:hypothetical protein
MNQCCCWQYQPGGFGLQEIVVVVLGECLVELFEERGLGMGLSG